MEPMECNGEPHNVTHTHHRRKLTLPSLANLGHPTQITIYRRESRARMQVKAALYGDVRWRSADRAACQRRPETPDRLQNLRSNELSPLPVHRRTQTPNRFTDARTADFSPLPIHRRFIELSPTPVHRQTKAPISLFQPSSNESSPIFKRNCLNNVPSPIPPRRLNGLPPESKKSQETNNRPSRWRERLRSQNMENAGKLKIPLPHDQEYDFTAEDLLDQGEIGRGAYGTVNKMIHEKSNTIMAVKRIRSTVDEKEQKELLMDLDVVIKSKKCPFIVLFYGALFKEGDCWICMELMTVSLDKFYKFIFRVLLERLPEDIIGKITVATVKALFYLKDKLKIIHRDIKPSNILLDLRGNIKLCDFGISGQLIDSIAKTRDAGCRPYMAPERIDPNASCRGYDVTSDVWSLGITLVEISTGKFPYPKWNSVFDQLTQVVEGEPPFLRNDSHFSPELVNFVNLCLTKNTNNRPKYNKLLNDIFIKLYEEREVDVAGYTSRIMDKMPHDLCIPDSQNST